MSKYSIKAILLKDCSYSNLAKKLLLDNKINSNFVTIKQEDKDIYKTDKIKTYPQIYLIKKYSYGNLLLGGCEDLNFIIDNFKNKEYDINKIKKFCDKYNWSKKSLLRLIELIN